MRAAVTDNITRYHIVSYSNGWIYDVKKLSFVVLLIVVLAPAPALAQQESISSSYQWVERSARTGPTLGYIFTNTGQYDVGPQSRGVLGARIRARVSSPLTIEGSFVWGNSTRQSLNPFAEGGAAITDTVALDYLLLEAAVQLSFVGARSINRLQPYMVLGGGIIIGLNEGIPDDLAAIGLERYRWTLGTQPVGLIGLGTEWHFASRFSASFEVRDHIWRLKAPDGWFDLPVLDAIADAGLTPPKDSEWTMNFEFGVTIWWYF